MKAESPQSDKSRLQNIYNEFLAKRLATYEVRDVQADFALFRIDVVQELLEILNIDVNSDDWASYKQKMFRYLKARVLRHAQNVQNVQDSASSSVPMGLQVHRLQSVQSQFLQDSSPSSHMGLHRLESTQSVTPNTGHSSHVFAADDGDDGDQPNDNDVQTENERLKFLIERKNRHISRLQKDKRMLQQKNRRLIQQMQNMTAKHNAELMNVRNDCDLSFQATRSSAKSKAWLTPKGIISVALRRNLGNIACALLQHTILHDVAGCTVSRCEVKCGAALAAHSQAFYQYMDHVLKSGGDSKSQLKFAIHCFRGDGTNSGIWRKSKLGCMEVESFFTTNGSSVKDALESGHHLRRLADVQRISDATGIGTAGLYFKQFQSIGLPTWYDLSFGSCNKAKILILTVSREYLNIFL